MTLWGAFTNTVDAMQAQSNALSVISQNIANVNTTGYKTVTDNFETVLSEQTEGQNIFGVQPVTQSSNDIQGNFQATGQWNNLAINGQGFFILNSSADGTGSTLYTRAGDFEQQASPITLPSAPNTSNVLNEPASSTVSYLTNGQGDYLMGWKAVNGVVTASDDLSSLSPVEIDLGATIAGKATSQITLQGALPSNVASQSSQAAEAQTITTKLSGTTSSSSFDPSTTQFFNTGTLQIQLGAVNTNTGVFTSSGSAVTVNVTDGSLQGVANAINSASAGVTASVIQDSSGNFQLQLAGNNTGANDGFQVTGTDAGTGAQSLTSLNYTASDATQNGTDYNVNQVAQDALTGTNGSVEAGIPVYDNQFNPQTLTATFTKTGSDAWTVSYSLPPGVGTVTTSSSSSSTPTTLTFDGAGNYDGQSGNSTVNVTWADGSTSSISVDFSKMSQLASGTLQLNTQTQDGYGAATLVKGEFDSNGNLYGDYSNGQKVLLYTLPVATFTAPNSLQSVNGTNFTQTGAAGTLDINEANTLNDTQFSPGNVETSNVDLDQQFSAMITTQTAYNSATKVFNVADQMTQSVRDLIT
ncbi:MAG TPA: flagellar hook-basal body complex protein [Magnetospirillaceae bacterium]|jgi:flagellar hook protein FlgE